jgi:hypothetical protein
VHPHAQPLRWYERKRLLHRQRHLPRLQLKRVALVQSHKRSHDLLQGTCSSKDRMSSNALLCYTQMKHLHKGLGIADSISAANLTAVCQHSPEARSAAHATRAKRIDHPCRNAPDLRSACPHTAYRQCQRASTHLAWWAAGPLQCWGCRPASNRHSVSQPAVVLECCCCYRNSSSKLMSHTMQGQCLGSSELHACIFTVQEVLQYLQIHMHSLARPGQSQHACDLAAHASTRLCIGSGTARAQVCTRYMMPVCARPAWKMPCKAQQSHSEMSDLTTQRSAHLQPPVGPEVLSLGPIFGVALIRVDARKQRRLRRQPHLSDSTARHARSIRFGIKTQDPQQMRSATETLKQQERLSLCHPIWTVRLG